MSAIAALLFGRRPVPLATPVPRLSTAPRHAAPSWGAAARSELRSTILLALAPAMALSHDRSSIVIAQDGSVLYSDGASHAVVPASAQKLIAADTALALLGSRYRFHTYFTSLRMPQAGTIAGDFWFAGSGDPSLRSDDLRRGVEKLRAGGLREITGRIAVDASALSGPELNATWDFRDSNEDFMAPTSAASVDEDTVEFRVAGTNAGSPATVRIKPSSAPITYSGTIATGYADDVVIAGTAAPNDFRISGTIPPRVRETFYLPIHDVPRYAGTVLARFLRHAGISVGGGPVTGKAPRNAFVLWDHPSPALAQLVHHMLIWSDNHFAEQFLRTFGGLRGGAADDRNGIAAELALLRRQGIPTPGLHLVDGSGLADANRVAAITLASILSHADSDPAGNSLYPLLARGGVDGTLKWYHFTQAAGRVRAKSGHLASVSSLAGYVDTRRHGRVVFAFLFNGSRDIDSALVAALDRIAQR